MSQQPPANDQTPDPRKLCDHLLKCWVVGFAEPRFLHVSYDEWERAHRVFHHTDGKGFLVIDTADGRLVAINLRHFLACHLLWDPGFHGIGVQTHEPVEEMRAYMRGLPEPITAAGVMSEDLLLAMLMLDTREHQEDAFILIGDEDDEKIAINLDELVWLELPKEWYDEAEREVEEEERAADERAKAAKAKRRRRAKPANAPRRRRKRSKPEPSSE